MYYSYAGAARVSACFALFFEEYSLVEFCKAKKPQLIIHQSSKSMESKKYTRSYFSWRSASLAPVQMWNTNTLCKSIPRMGICYSKQCRLPGRMVESSRYDQVLWVWAGYLLLSRMPVWSLAMACKTVWQSCCCEGRVWVKAATVMQTWWCSITCWASFYRVLRCLYGWIPRVRGDRPVVVVSSIYFLFLKELHKSRGKSMQMCGTILLFSVWLYPDVYVLGRTTFEREIIVLLRESAVLARYFEEYIAVELHKTQALMNFPKIVELYLDADEHTLVKFFRKFPALAWMINTKKWSLLQKLVFATTHSANFLTEWWNAAKQCIVVDVDVQPTAPAGARKLIGMNVTRIFRLWQADFRVNSTTT